MPPQRVLDKMRCHAMAVHAALLCLLLFAGRLAEANKLFAAYGGEGEKAAGGGGYGGETGGGSTAAKDAPYGTLTPTKASTLAGGSFIITPTPTTASEGSYSNPTPVNPSPEALSTPAGRSFVVTPTPITASEGTFSTPSTATPSTLETPEADQSGGGAYTGGQQSASSSEPENGLNEKSIADIVNEHNVFRAKEHVPPLKWNATLAKFAQQYAEKLKATGCKMEHSTSPYGENLMWGSGPLTWKKTVDEWSAEKKSYNYGSNTCEPGKMCGHYTAVVWKDTTGVGCGRVKCTAGETMEVCSYWPPGNYQGEKPY
ncbi:hypothetical protein ACP70R_032234 [Stipagrostis hirtigluma subsp. patula]